MKYLFKNKSMVNNNSGIALPLVLMVMLILILFGTAAYTASQSSLKQSVRLDPSLQCKYLARSAVDATKEAWKAQWINDSTTVSEGDTFYTRYNVAEDEFESVTAESEYDDDYVIKTEQTYNDGVCTITSSVKIGDYSATVKARSEKLTDTVVTGETVAAADRWYEKRTYRNLFIPWDEWTILPGPNSETVSDKEGQEYSGTYHEAEGIVNIDTEEGETLYLNGTMRQDLSEAILKFNKVLKWFSDTKPWNVLDQLKPTNNPLIQYNVTGLQAKKIVFQCPLNLYNNTSLFLGVPVQNPCSLILSAETIIFEKKLTIGDSAYGNLTLRLPPGSGIPGDVVLKRVDEANKERTAKVNLNLIDPDAMYGIVKFSGVDVVLSNVDPKNNVGLIDNDQFYFRVMNEKALNIGTEPNTFSRLADIFGITKETSDCRFGTLIDNGYLIPATDSDLQEFTDILFFYE